MFRREAKIQLIFGFVGVLVVAILFVDHLSGTNRGTPAGPLDTDPLASNGLVVTVPDSGQPRGPLTPANPFRVAIEDGVDELARRGGDAVQGMVDGINGLREDVRPESASQTIAGSDGSGPIEPPGWIMGERPDGTGQTPPGGAGGAPTGGTGLAAAENRTHRVAPGETLWRLAEQYYGDPSLHRALAAYNKERLTAAGQPRSGASIIIPPRAVLLGTAVPAAPGGPGTAAAPAGAGTPTATAAARVYEVKRGDTLSQISQRQLGTARRWEEILRLNADQMSTADDLRVGMKIKLPAR